MATESCSELCISFFCRWLFAPTVFGVEALWTVSGGKPKKEEEEEEEEARQRLLFGYLGCWLPKVKETISSLARPTLYYSTRGLLALVVLNFSLAVFTEPYINWKGCEFHSKNFIAH